MEGYLIATVAFVMALMTLLILGFLRLDRELLSRSVHEIPLCRDQNNSEHVERESSHWQPGMVEYGEPHSLPCQLKEIGESSKADEAVKGELTGRYLAFCIDALRRPAPKSH
jgi:hypothetical protein